MKKKIIFLIIVSVIYLCIPPFESSHYSMDRKGMKTGSSYIQMSQSEDTFSTEKNNIRNTDLYIQV